MQFIGGPMKVQNTDSGDWIVQLDDAVTSSAGERVSITVAVKRDPHATLPDVQRRAVDRAVELLQGWKAASPAR